MSCMRKSGLIRRCVQFTLCGILVAAVIYFAVTSLILGETVSYLPHTHGIDMLMLVVEWGLVVLVFYYSFKFRKYYCALLSIVQTGLMTWLELTGRTEIPGNHIYADKLTIAMSLIIGIVGCLICVYALGYMKDYNRHHLDYKDRRYFFFGMLFLFLGAMMGLIFSSNLIWIYFFWEITSICSFLLIGYNQTDEAMENSFKALWMNLLGGFAFAVAIVVAAHTLHTVQLAELVADGATIPVVLLALAGAVEELLAEKAPHGKICLGFTPDEEIGMGASFFDVASFGADFAYTLDGGDITDYEYETFNAAMAHVTVNGFSIHPGTAKGKMKNALLMAMEFNALLPVLETPGHTEGYEGFFHLCDMSGDVEHAKLHYIVRDHDRATFEMRKKTLEHAAKTINEKYAREVIRLTIKDSYYNMAEKIAPHMELIENAKRACEKAGMKPFIEAVRGGTDGCRLSFMGLPTPNLCTGGFAFHGPYEHIAVESMDRCAKMVEYLMLGE